MKAIIMAGGKGTRVAGLTKNQIPKPMLRLAGRPILEWQLLQLKKYGITDVVMVIGYLGGVIREYFGDGSAWGVHIAYITETEPLGTAGALYYLKNAADFTDADFNTGVIDGTHHNTRGHTGNDTGSDAQSRTGKDTGSDTQSRINNDTGSDAQSRTGNDAGSDTQSDSNNDIHNGIRSDVPDDAYFFCMGDIFFDFDIARMKKFHDEKGVFITLLAHPNMHPQDSDLVVTDSDGRVTAFDSKHNVRDNWFDNLVNAGIFIFSPTVPNLVKSPVKMSLEKELIAPLLAEKKVYAYVTPEFVRDVGTPDRIAATEEDIGKGMTAAKNLEKKQKAIFLDRDGTINEARGFIAREEDFVLEKNAAEAIRRINRSGYLAIVVTNQPVIARGEATFAQVETIHRKMKTLLGREGCYVDGILYCPHHPDKGFVGEIAGLKIKCSCRKPGTGMIEEAARRWNIDIAGSWVIGDGTADIEMGRRAGCGTVLVKTGQAGKDGKYNAVPDFVAEDILDAVNMILRR